MTEELWLPVNLSMLFPGLGQLYSGQTQRGWGLAIAEIGLLTLAAWSIFAPAGNTLSGLLLLVLAGAVYVWSVFDVYQRGKRRAGVTQKSLTEIARTTQNPWFAVFLSHVLPGLGHLYLHSAVWAAVFLSTLLIASTLTPQFPQLFFFSPLIWALACYHAYTIATPQRRWTRPWILTVVIAIAVLRFTIGYFPVWANHAFQRFIVPSESMVPTLQVGDQMFVPTNRRYQPHAQDVIVFHVPEVAQELAHISSDTFFVKRVVGLPGQTVQIFQGQVLIDNQPLQESYISEPPRYDWGPETVPPNYYFVLGDNRNDSADSHIWGFLPSDRVVGKVTKIYWPPSRIRSLS